MIASGSTHTTETARGRLEALEAERALAVLAGLGDNRAYMDDLHAEIAASRAAFVGLAVTDIATLRGELFGRQDG